MKRKKPAGMSIDLPYGEFPFFDHEVRTARAKRDNAIKEACCGIVFGQCSSDNEAQRIVDAIRATKEPT